MLFPNLSFRSTISSTASYLVKPTRNEFTRCLLYPLHDDILLLLHYKDAYIRILCDG